MSVRADASLYSEVARIERGDFLRFHCEQLSHLQRDIRRYFFGVYYPRWHSFYLEEVREIIGNLGYTQMRHFPAHPLDVYCKETGETYLTDDFVVDNILVIGQPQNQRDDDMKRFKIVSVDDTTLRTKTGNASSGLPAIKRSNTVGGNTLRSIQDSSKSFQASTRRNNDSAINNDSARSANTNANVDANATSSMLLATSTAAGVGAVHVSVTLEEEVVAMMTELRDAYIQHAGGGIPEIGIKAMGRPFRKPAADGRRWMTLLGLEALVHDSRGFGLAQPASLALTQRSQAQVRRIAEALYNAFPHGGDEDLVLGDTLNATTLSGLRGSRGGGAAGMANTFCSSVAALPAAGGVDYDVFMDFIRGHMSSERKKAVWNIFTKLDFDNDGLIAIHDIQARFNAQEHPVVVRDGFFTAEGLLKGFLVLWDENNKHYGMVSYAEFLDYYNGLSAVIKDDAVFFSILKTSWKMPLFAQASVENYFTKV